MVKQMFLFVQHLNQPVKEYKIIEMCFLSSYHSLVFIQKM